MWGVEEIVGISGDPVRSASDRDTIGTAPRPVPRRGTGVPFPVTTRVVESEKTARGGTHVRIEFEGPLKAWQTWDYEPSGGGTLVPAEIEYASSPTACWSSDFRRGHGSRPSRISRSWLRAGQALRCKKRCPCTPLHR